MTKQQKLMKTLPKLLRPVFGICLFLAQFVSNRKTFFTDNIYLVLLGIFIFIAGVFLSVISSVHLQKAVQAKAIVMSGPFEYIRHPIYLSIYILCTGLGFLFFSWFWFLVLLIFIPFWYWEGKEEEKQLIGQFGMEYIAYQRKTNMFLPSLRSLFKNTLG